MSRTYSFRSASPDVVKGAVEEALDQIRAYPEAVATELGISQLEVQQALEVLGTGYEVKRPTSSGITGAELQVLLIILPSALKIVDSVWDNIILPWLKTRQLEGKRKD